MKKAQYTPLPCPTFISGKTSPLDTEHCATNDRHAFQALLDEVKKRNTVQFPVVPCYFISPLKAATVAGTMRVSANRVFPSALWEKGTTTWHSDTSIALRTSKAVITTHAIAALLPVSFDEPYPHSVSIIELEKGRATTSTREIENPIPLVTLPMTRHLRRRLETAGRISGKEKPAYLSV